AVRGVEGDARPAEGDAHRRSLGSGGGRCRHRVRDLRAPTGAGVPGGGVWGGSSGFFIFRGAQASEQRIGIDGRLASATVAEAMDPPPPAVPADLSLSQTLDRFLRGHEEEAFPVVQDGTVIGMISLNSARALGGRDPLRPARDAIIPLQHVLVAHPDERLDEVSARLGTDRAALVLRDGRLVGAISGSGLYRWAARAGWLWPCTAAHISTVHHTS